MSLNCANYRRIGTSCGLLAVCGLCALVGTSGGIGGAYDLLSSTVLSNKEQDRPTLLLTATGNEVPWASESDLQELACLTRLVTKQMTRQGNLGFSVKMTPDLSREPEQLMTTSTNESPSHEAINLMNFWTPNDIIQANLVLQRIAKTNFSQIVIPVFVPQSDEQRNKAFLAAFKSLAAKTNPPLTVQQEVADSSASASLQSLQKAINENGDNKVFVLLVGNTDKLAGFLQLAASDKKFATLAADSSTWVHPNAFNFVESLNKESPILNFLDKVGFSTTLYFPQTNHSDAQLRKFKFVLKSGSCGVTSVQRSHAFVKKLEEILKPTENHQKGRDYLVTSWQAWNLFIAGLGHQHLVETVQDSHFLLDETFSVEERGSTSSRAVVLVRSENGINQSEVVRKDHLLQVYSPIALDCKEALVEVDSWDHFTLNQVARKYQNPSKTMPAALIIPINNGFTVTLSCQGNSNKAPKTAKITCSGHPAAPCVHSAFRPNAKRTKRGISQVRQLLAALDAQKSPFVIGTPFDPHAPINADFQKRMSGSDAHKNGTAEADYDPERIPYRIRQKAAVVYKVLYDQGLNSDQMLKALPSVIASSAVRKEAERLVQGLPDTRMLQAISSRQGSSAPPKPPKYPLPPYAKWLLGSLSAVTACIGTSTGVLLCTMLAEVSGATMTVAGCHQGGFHHIGGSCMVMMGRIYQAVADDNSVICSALHSRGLLDDFAFATDSAFGYHLAAEDPLVLEGYHAMAKPVANLIKQSGTFSTVMNAISKPWIEQMMFESGYVEEQSLTGKLILDYGIPFARRIGKVKRSIDQIDELVTGDSTVLLVSLATAFSVSFYYLMGAKIFK